MYQIWYIRLYRVNIKLIFSFFITQTSSAAPITWYNLRLSLRVVFCDSSRSAYDSDLQPTTPVQDLHVLINHPGIYWIGPVCFSCQCLINHVRSAVHFFSSHRRYTLLWRRNVCLWASGSVTSTQSCGTHLEREGCIYSVQAGHRSVMSGKHATCATAINIWHEGNRLAAGDQHFSW